MPSYLAPAILTSTTMLAAAVIAAIALSDGLRPATRHAAVLAAGGAIVLWLPLAQWLAAQGVFAQGADTRFPAIAVAIAGPVIAFLAALRLSPGLRRVADGLDQRWLIAVQALRVMGAVFVLLWAQSVLPWQFALPAGLGDVAVGLVALVALRRTLRAPQEAGRWAARVNAAGLLDFAAAVGTGLAIAPGALQVLSLDAPNHAINSYPLVLIPAFAVPLFIIVHILSIRLALRPRTAASRVAAA